MKPEEIKEKVNQYKWERWLERPFGGFILSLFAGGNSRSSTRKIGVNVEHIASVYEKGAWYESDDVYKLAAVDIEKEVKKGFSIKLLSKNCEKFRDKNKKVIGKITGDRKMSNLKKLKKITDILRLNTSYIWFCHDYEHYLNPILKREVPKYLTGEIDKLIGDLGYPEKKSSHNYLEEELMAGVDLAKLVEKYGWIKSRDSFSDPFTVAEFKELKESIKKENKTAVPKIKVPKPLKKLVEELKELVYFRTLRTDVFYELLFIARPVMNAVAADNGLLFKELRDYSVMDLLDGKLKKYPDIVTFACYKNEYAFFEKPILPEQKIGDREVKGVVAYAGVAKGYVKVVTKIEEIDKVKAGDVMVTFMTAPSHITAMKRAAAFVTDEGGITCHAAIVAREMKKPCIIGTKIATKVLKDGDFVEVDALKGIVKILKRNG